MTSQHYVASIHISRGPFTRESRHAVAAPVSSQNLFVPFAEIASQTITAELQVLMVNEHER
jgi:hypothetical protein